MKQVLFFLTLTILFFSCKEETVTDVKKETVEVNEPDSIPSKNSSSDVQKGEVEIIENVYTEFYPDEKRRIKFQGVKDDNGKRTGKWLYFSYEGEELSMTTFDHGKKHGPTIVKYPNGKLYYTGEYQDDKTVGLWKTYSEAGTKLSEKDYGYPSE